MGTGIHVRHLASAESECDFHPVSLCQELSCRIDLCRQVIGIDIGRKADLLDLHSMLLALGILFTAGLFVIVFTVINNLAYGRFRIR